MKKLTKISLHCLEQEPLASQSMRCLKGGNSCTCGCHYSTSSTEPDFAGHTSTGENDAANYEYNLTSIGGGSESCGCSGSSGSSMSEFWKA